SAQHDLIVEIRRYVFDRAQLEPPLLDAQAEFDQIDQLPTHCARQQRRVQQHVRRSELRRELQILGGGYVELSESRPHIRSSATTRPVFLSECHPELAKDPQLRRSQRAAG